MSIQADRVIAERTAKTVYLVGDSAVKLFDINYPASAVLSEAQRQALASESGLKAPRVLKVEPDEGRFAIWSEYIPGITLWEAMKAAEDISPLLNNFVDLQMTIHDVLCMGTGMVDDTANTEHWIKDFLAHCCDCSS